MNVDLHTAPLMVAHFHATKDERLACEAEQAALLARLEVAFAA
ncbi:hypothetical protein [Angustibacter luteus]|uniref:Uncharacterized protein n=1 Tax=Angustibacter luteus TaxID=658456 RepID=A0ABW1JJE2_9ACTN